MKNKYEIMMLKKHNIQNQIINNNVNNNNNNSKLGYSFSSTNISSLKDYSMKQENKKKLIHSNSSDFYNKNKYEKIIIIYEKKLNLILNKLLTESKEAINKEKLILSLKADLNYHKKINKDLKAYLSHYKKITSNAKKNYFDIINFKNNLKIEYKDNMKIINDYDYQINEKYNIEKNVKKLNEKLNEKKTEKTILNECYNELLKNIENHVKKYNIITEKLKENNNKNNKLYEDILNEDKNFVKKYYELFERYKKLEKYYNEIINNKNNYKINKERERLKQIKENNDYNIFWKEKEIKQENLKIKINNYHRVINNERIKKNNEKIKKEHDKFFGKYFAKKISERRKLSKNDSNGSTLLNSSRKTKYKSADSSILSIYYQ